MNVIMDSFRIAWIDMCYVKRNLFTVMITSCISPLLYLLAFGYGLGKGMVVEGFDYMAFMIPGIISLSTMNASFNTVASKVLIQRSYYQSFDELHICSMTHLAVVLGKSYLGVVRGVISCTIIYALGMIICDDIRFSLLTVFLILLSSLVFSVLGVMAGLIANSHLTLTLINSLIILPMTFFCGTIFSLDALPKAISTVISILPLTQATNCIRSTILGTGLDPMSLTLFIIYGVIFCALARFVLKSNRV